MSYGPPMPAQMEFPRPITCSVCACDAYRVPPYLTDADDPLVAHYTLYCEFHWTHWGATPCIYCAGGGDGGLRGRIDHGQARAWARLRAERDRA